MTATAATPAVATPATSSKLSVNTLTVKGKWKIRGRSIGRSQDWKKAMVVLQEGQTIDVL